MRAKNRPAAPVPLIASLMVLGLVLGGCVRYASIERRSGPPLNAQIKRSDTEKLFVTTEDGRQEIVNRSDIVNINHPGTGRLAWGSVIAGVGAGMLIYGLTARNCTGQHSDEGCEQGILNFLLMVDGVAGLLVGGTLAASGGFDYFDSVSAATPLPSTTNPQSTRHSLPRLTCSFCPQQARVIPPGVAPQNRLGWTGYASGF